MNEYHDEPKLYPQAGRDGVFYLTERQIDGLDPVPVELQHAARTLAAVGTTLTHDAGDARLLADIRRSSERTRAAASAKLVQPVRHLRPVVALVIAVAVSLGAVLAQAIPASAAVAATKGPGLELKAEGRTVHVGGYYIAGRLMYCTDWALELGDGTVRQGSGPAKLDAETRARVNTVVNTYGVTADNRTAARVKLALDTLIAPKDARLAKALPALLAQVTSADRAAVAAMVAASAVHGPYRVAVKLTAAAPGSVGTATATVLGSNGKPAAGRVVSWVVGGGDVAVASTGTGKALTGSDGTLSITYRATGLAQSVTATVAAPSSSAVWQNVPSKGHQLMVGGGFTETARGSATATLCPVTLQVVKTCACGKATRTAIFTFTADTTPGQYVAVVKVNGVVAASDQLAAGQRTQVTVQIPATGQPVEVEAGVTFLEPDGGNAGSQVLDSWTQR